MDGSDMFFDYLWRSLLSEEPQGGKFSINLTFLQPTPFSIRMKTIPLKENTAVGGPTRARLISGTYILTTGKSAG